MKGRRMILRIMRVGDGWHHDEVGSASTRGERRRNLACVWEQAARRETTNVVVVGVGISRVCKVVV